MSKPKSPINEQLCELHKLGLDDLRQIMSYYKYAGDRSACPQDIGYKLLVLLCKQIIFERLKMQSLKNKTK